ncbi:hypothetical protein C4587_01275 [Candidatus Parcubacteria bacterium]|nr:MAG: hypothetical protein C4587_01275 [Candidatus Parcubacteria bacterium]
MNKEQWEQLVRELVEHLGFSDYRVEVQEEPRRGAIFIYDSPALLKEHLPLLVESVNHLVQLVSRKHNDPPIFFDINNYRQERENLISELARAAAKKVLATKEAVALPAMNSYERRLVHVALAIHPEVITESIGTGKERYVVIKLLQEKPSSLQGA